MLYIQTTSTRKIICVGLGIFWLGFFELKGDQVFGSMYTIYHFYGQEQSSS